MNRVYGVCSLSIFRLEFPAGGASLYPLAKVPAESGGGRRWHRRCQLPGSVRDRRHDRAAIRVSTACVARPAREFARVNSIVPVSRARARGPAAGGSISQAEPRFGHSQEVLLVLITGGFVR